MCVFYLTFVDILYEASACTSCVCNIINILYDDKCVGESGRTSCGCLGLLLIGTINYEILGIKIGFKMGVLET